MSITDLTLVELRDQLRSGAISSVEATTAVLERIATADDKLQSYVTLTAEKALAQAHTADERLASGESSPLLGVPVAIKDLICNRGIKTQAGSRILEGFKPPYDAFVTEKLKAAGAVIVGMTNTDAFGMGSSTENSGYQVTKNPWDMSRTPGGSSGGSGAAVAAGLCDIALGTDTMGSVRIPASYCGVYGFKPAQSAVSQDGLELAEPTLDVIGPLARSLNLLEQAARLTSEFGEADLPGQPVTLAGLAGVECTTEVLAVYERACAALGAGAAVALPDPPSRVRYAGFIATAQALHAALADAPPETLSPTLARLIAYGPRRKPEDRAADAQVLARTAERLNAIVTEHGPLLLPTAPQPAFDHAEPAPANQADFTCLANVANLPAITLPAGTAANGMPIGVQLIGPRGAESGLFALARRLDSHLAAYRQPNHFYQG
ncbi:MAG: hypothetical protein KDE51_06175 [Anaerolineales bacterium]|nr:hypothetical protein [Anaerolineales bacterium]